MKNLQHAVMIETLLLCHYKSEPIPSRDAPAVKESLYRLGQAGAIEPARVTEGGSVLAVPEHGEGDPEIYGTTALGKKWVERLCTVEMPTIWSLKTYKEGDRVTWTESKESGGGFNFSSKEGTVERDSTEDDTQVYVRMGNNRKKWVWKESVRGEGETNQLTEWFKKLAPEEDGD